MHKPPVATLGMLSAIALAGPSVAQTRDWSGQITPYVWGTGLSGTLRPGSGAPKLEFDESFSEVLENLDAAFFLTGFARRGDFVLLGDVTYSAVSSTTTILSGVDADGEVIQTSLTLAAGYRLYSGIDGTIDILGGFRAWWMDVSVDVPAIGASAEKDLNFVDPIVALRGNVRLAPRWSAIGYFDVGGFGVGSDLTYQVVATVNYEVSKHVAVSAGYRYLFVDFDDDGTRLEAEFSGPLVGLTWRF